MSESKTPLDDVLDVVSEIIANNNRMRMSIPADLARDHDVRLNRAASWARKRIAQLEAERAELVEAWRSWLSAQDTIDKVAFMDNYTDAARARETQSKITFEVRQILAKHKEQA